jgi:hypothetical protein
MFFRFIFGGERLSVAAMTETEIEPDSAERQFISNEAWEALRIASIKGVPDSELAETFGVTREAIRKRRSRDEFWSAVFTPPAGAPGSRELLQKEQESQVSHEKAEIAQKAALTIQEAIQGGKLQNELLLLKLAGNGLRSAEGNLPQVKQWSDIKAIADIVSKIGPQAQAAVQVNVLTDGQAQFSTFDFPNFESEAIEIESEE